VEAFGGTTQNKRPNTALTDDDRLLNKRWLRITSWVLSGIALVVGFAIGMTQNANVGGALWLASAILALLPFLDHRQKTC